MLDFATRYLKIGVMNNQSFAYHFVGNLLLYLIYRFFLCQALRLLQADMGFGRENASFRV